MIGAVFIWISLLSSHVFPLSIKGESFYDPVRSVKGSNYKRNKILQFIYQIEGNEVRNHSFILVASPEDLDSVGIIQNLLDDSAFFSKKELDQFKRLNGQKITIWTKKEFPYITVISDYPKEHKDSNGLMLVEWPAIHSFSIPFFIRNYKFCIFYSGYSCGLTCGLGHLNLYKRVNGRWRYCKSYGRRIS